MRFTNTITIDRPPAEVFAFLARFENVPLWNEAIRETRKISPGPVGVGSRYVQTRSLPTRREETFEVTEYEPDRSLAIRGTFGPFPGRSPTCSSRRAPPPGPPTPWTSRPRVCRASLPL